MAAYPSLNSEKIIQHLRRQIQDLRVTNDKLNARIKQMESGGRRPSQMLASCKRSAQQHRRAAKKLAGAYVWIIIGWFFLAICGIIMCFPSGLIFVLRFSEQKSFSRWLTVTYLSAFTDPKIVTVATGCLGIIIAIVGQRVFPAPWRTFSAVFAFGAKQMADIFLPDWCILFLILFAALAMATIDLDRNKQVGTDKSFVSKMR